MGFKHPKEFFEKQQHRLSMDLEGFAKNVLKKLGDSKAVELLSERIAEIKGGEAKDWIEWAEAIVLEVKNTEKAFRIPVLSYYNSGIKAGEAGVGSRGEGDFYVHSLIAEIISSTGVSGILSAKDLDDAGVVEIPNSNYIYVAVDGIHSRLSEFPFIAGFHVTRAAMRDVLVMNALPVAVFSDIHIADDGDVSKIFDHIAGICSVCELTGTPLIAGSTLRIGGDMVIGERFSGGVGCVGVGERIAARRDASSGDIILLTEGAGGGTVSTAAIYYGYPEIVEETINIDFLRACEPIVKKKLEVHAMTDVTNGGIRGDAEEIARVSNKRLIFEGEVLRKVVNPKIMKFFEEVGIDFLGVSIDSLMVICNEETAENVKRIVKKAGIKIYEVGRVEEGETGAFVEEDGMIKRLKPKFRESAYTPIKKVVGEKRPENYEEMKEKIRKAAEMAIKKKNEVVKMLFQNSSLS
jgi:hydrogenase expression/formation protein